MLTINEDSVINEAKPILSMTKKIVLSTTDGDIEIQVTQTVDMSTIPVKWRKAATMLLNLQFGNNVIFSDENYDKPKAKKWWEGFWKSVRKWDKK